MSTVPFAVAGIDHIVLRAQEPARLTAFYRDVLGCPVEREQPHIGLVQLRAGRCLIDILPRSGRAGTPGDPTGEQRNLDHLCLVIEPFEADALTGYLRSKGVRMGELASRYGAEGEGPSLYIQDPEGNGVELKARAHGSRQR